jgi:hypothetical protein
MRRVIQRLAILAFAILASVGPSAGGESKKCKPLYGVTYTHYQLDPNAVCRNGKESAAVLAEGAIIPNYDNQAVRERVRGQLAAMRVAGVNMIRTVLWYTQDRIIAPWGQLSVPLRSEDAKRLEAFGEDIRVAGFEHWLLAFSPGNRNNPACAIKTWGDCYDASREAASFDFIRSVHEALKPLGGPGFKLEYDLASERCPSRWLPDQANQNITTYLTHLLQWYSKNLSSTDFHVACGGLAEDRMAALLAIYDAAGVKPNAIDIHFYDTDPAKIEPKLVPAARMARERGVPLIIGEMLYENPLQIEAISSIAAQNDICPAQIIEWPLRSKSLCQMNVQPPFSPELLRSKIPR